MMEKSLNASEDNMPTHLDLHIFSDTQKYIPYSHRLFLCPLVLWIKIPFPGWLFLVTSTVPQKAHGMEKKRLFLFYTLKANLDKRTNTDLPILEIYIWNWKTKGVM